MWSARHQLPREVEQDWRSTLPGAAPTRVLAASATPDGWAVASLPRLSIRDAGGSWTHTAWHEIEHGGWNVELSRLAWTRTDGRRGSALLADPGRLPALFRERVKASIVFQHTVSFTEAGGIAISARRDLTDPGAPLVWNASLQRGLTWQQPGVRELADESLARFRAEFDPA